MQKLITVLLTAAIVPSSSAESVWVEGEAAGKKSVQGNGWYESVKKDELSGDAFLAHWGDQVGSASYAVNIPEDGSYVLWLRANPVGSKLNLSFDGGEWFDVNFKRYGQENINIASDDKPDLRFVAWVRAGVRKFTAGEHEIRVRFNSDNHHHGALDCFCLTTDTAWKPSRKLKPDEERPHWPVPEVTDANLDRWIEFVRPSDDELGWRKVRWHDSLSEAAEEATRLQRPILLWAMNGHPCGET